MKIKKEYKNQVQVISPEVAVELGLPNVFRLGGINSKQIQGLIELGTVKPYKVEETKKEDK